MNGKAASPVCRLKSADPGVRPECRVRLVNPRGTDARITNGGAIDPVEDPEPDPESDLFFRIGLMRVCG